MAQSSISSFFAVRRKRTDGQGTAKRRKLEDGTKQVISHGVDREKINNLKIVTSASSLRPSLPLSTPSKSPALPGPSTPSKSPALPGPSTPSKSPALPRPSTPSKSPALPGPSTPSKSPALPGPSTPSKSPALPRPSTPSKSPAPGPSTPSKSPALPRPSTPSKSPALPGPSTPSKSPALPRPSTPSKSTALPGPSTPSKSTALPGPSTPSKSPARPKITTSEFSPQLNKFESFVVESPTKKNPSVTRKLTYEQCRALAQPTPAVKPVSRLSPPSSSPLQGISRLSHKMPAYKKFQSLAKPVHQQFDSLTKPSPSQLDSKPNLPLPFNYNLLVEKFRCVDTIVSMMQKRKEKCTFDKLKQAVQEMTRRNFNKKDLARIRTIFPEALLFKQEKNIPGIYGHQRYSEYQLTVEAAGEDGEALPTGDSLNITVLMNRKEEFRSRITRVVLQHHKDFLASLDPPVEIPEDKLFRWHPLFPLDTIPDVEEDHLPSSPQLEKYSTASDVLAATHNKFTARVKQALKNTAQQHSLKDSQAKDSTSPSTSAPTHHLLKGVSSALLERVRQKEVAKAAATMTRSPEVEQQLEMCSRLAEMCRILRIYFVAEKKAALTWEAVVDKLSESHSSGLPSSSVEKHLNLLLSLLPHWITKVTVRKRTYLKINKETSLKVLITELQNKEKNMRK